MPGLEAAKAYAALIGGIATALLAVFTIDTPVGKVLTVVSIVATAIVAYHAPYAPRPRGPRPARKATSQRERIVSRRKAV